MVKKILNINTLLKIISLVSIVSTLLAYISPYISPKTLWILPFFGLSYPILFFVNLLLTLIWIFKKSKWAITIIVIIIIGIPLDLRFFALGNPDILPQEEKEAIHIMSYNVQLFGVYNFDLEYNLQNRDSILNYIQKENPDLICFQEFFYKKQPTDFNTRDTLISALNIKDYHEKYSFNKQGNRFFGISIHSKHKIIHKGEVIFEDVDKISEDNYCIYTDILKGKDTFRIYNIHFQSIKFKKEEYALFSNEETENDILVNKKSALMLMVSKLRKAFPIRADQALTVINHIDKSPYPVIICGDFNDTPLSFTYNQFNKKYVDAFRNNGYGIGKTFVGKIPAGRIDYIFHSNDLNSYQFKLQEEVFSDHRAISCKVYKK